METQIEDLTKKQQEVLIKDLFILLILIKINFKFN